MPGQMGQLQLEQNMYQKLISDYIGKAQNTIIVNNLGGTILASKYLEKQNDPKMDELKKKVEKNPDNSYVQFSI